MNDEITLFHDLTVRLAEAGTPQPVADLVLASYQGEDVLDETLAGGTPSRPTADGEITTDQTDVFLESIKVTGFRGVGRTATLSRQPKAGLTLAIGRNGSGKSSFAGDVATARLSVKSIEVL